MDTRSAIAHALRRATIVVTLAAAACGTATEPPKRAAAPGEWHEFEGSWNAAGNRRSLTLGADRRASIIDLRGTLLLSGPARPGVGFRAEAIGLVDNTTGFTGRATWTDERGDQVFSELKGDGTASHNRITGTILGGTGRYLGANGTYEFSWRFVIETDDGSIQGSSQGLKGRVRAGTATGAKP